MTEPAPLIAIAGLPIPRGGAAEWFYGQDGARLRAALYPATGEPRGAVVLSPGRVEPIEKYHEVVGELQGRGFTVLCHDWRGQGLSHRDLPDRVKGHARGADYYLTDYTQLLDHFEERLPKPWVQMGHSMGGGLSLYVLAKGERRFAASALSAPMVAPFLGAIPYWAARALSWAAVGFGQAGAYTPSESQDPLRATFETDHIAHDRTRWERFRTLLAACPDLTIGNLTWGWLDFALSMSTWLQTTSAVTAIETPVLIVAAGDDDRVRTDAAEKLCHRLPRSLFVEIPDAWHEILMETDDIRAIWWREFDGLMEREGI